MIVQEEESLYLADITAIGRFVVACRSFGILRSTPRSCLRHSIGYGNLLDEKGSLHVLDFMLMESLAPERQNEHVEIDWPRLSEMGIEQAIFEEDRNTEESWIPRGVNCSRVKFQRAVVVPVVTSVGEVRMKIAAGAISGVIDAASLNKLTINDKGECNLWVNRESSFFGTFSGNVAVVNSNLRYGHLSSCIVRRCYSLKGFDINDSIIEDVGGKFIAVTESKIISDIDVNISVFDKARISGGQHRISYSYLQDSTMHTPAYKFQYIGNRQIMSFCDIKESSVKRCNLTNLTAYKCTLRDSTITGGSAIDSQCRNSEIHECTLLSTVVEKCVGVGAELRLARFENKFVGD